jgi:E3 ubiquitin-protein ligase RNF115/126
VAVQVGVSHDIVNKLHTITHEKGKQQGECVEDTCTVCREVYAGQDTVMQLPCKHWFHQECISTWLHGSKMCPICMAEVVAVEGKQETELTS